MAPKSKYQLKPDPKKEGVHMIWFAVFTIVLVFGLTYTFQPYQPSHPDVVAAEYEEW